MYNDNIYGTSGPGLSAPARDRLGWLPINRVFTPPPNAYRLKLTLTSLSKNTAQTSGYLMARIPIYTTVDEPYAYYTVEYRTEGVDYDQGLKNLGLDSNGIVIHRVTETDQANWVLYPRFPAFGKDFGWCTSYPLSPIPPLIYTLSPNTTSFCRQQSTNKTTHSSTLSGA